MLKILRSCVVAGLALVVVAPASFAAAQTDVLKKMDEIAAEKKKAADEAKAKEAAELAKKLKAKAEPDGWKPFLSLGATTSVGSSSNVVGRVDGQTYSLGATANGRLNLKRGQHEWNNRLGFQLQQTNTPALTGWVKSLDMLKVESSYVYSPSANFGLYAGLSVDTSVFGTEDVRPGPTSYRIKEPNGTFSGDTGGFIPAGATSIKQVLLTKEFAPTTVGQGVGANFKIWEGRGHKFNGRAGLGATEVLARGGVAITDDAATPTIVEATRLQDYQQVGGQLRVTAEGAFAKNITYSFLLDFLLPFYNSLDTGKSFLDTVNVTMDLKMGFKVSKWFSLEYVLGLRRQPLLVDKWQMWQGLLASFSFTVLE